MVTIIGVRFRNAGKIYYFDPGDKTIPRGTCVIVETARGFEMGTVIVPNKEVEDETVVQPLKPVIRIANEDDFNIIKENKLKQKEAYFICKEKIRKHELQMKLVDVEYTFDNNKILFYFTADGRIDFRELVKDLASVFKTRIELRQIGVRDETKMLGGVGICGRGLCCATYLSDFVPVSIRMAKEQNLSLNPTKISGVCGRLMCCLKNEEDTYEYLNSRLPSVGEKVVIKEDNIAGEVQSVNVLRQKVKVLIHKDDDDTEMREVLVDDLKFLGKKKGSHGAGEEGNSVWAEAGAQEEEASAEELAMLEDQPVSAEEGEERRGHRENPRKDRGENRERRNRQDNRENREGRQEFSENGEGRENRGPRPERGDRSDRRNRQDNRENRESREARPENGEGRETRESRTERGERNDRRNRSRQDNRENREPREARPENGEGRETRESRPERGERNDRRNRSRQDNRENREPREARPENGEGREPRENRPERGERSDRRDRRGRQDNRDNREARPENGESREPRQERGEGRENRPERGERNDRRDRRSRQDNRENREPRPENGEGRENREGRPERGERSERNPRNGEEGGREEHRGRRNDRRRNDRRNPRREGENAQ